MTVEAGKKRGFRKTKVFVEPANIVMNNKIDISAVKEDFGWESHYKLQESVDNIMDCSIINYEHE